MSTTFPPSLDPLDVARVARALCPHVVPWKLEDYEIPTSPNETAAIAHLVKRMLEKPENRLQVSLAEGAWRIEAAMGAGREAPVRGTPDEVISRFASRPRPNPTLSMGEIEERASAAFILASQLAHPTAIEGMTEFQLHLDDLAVIVWRGTQGTAMSARHFGRLILPM